MGKKFITILFFCILLISILSVYAEDAPAQTSSGADTSGAAAGGTTASNEVTTKPVSSPSTEKPAEIKPAEGTTGTIQGGTYTPDKDGKGGEATIGGKSEDGKTDLGSKGSVDVKTADGSETKLDNVASGSKTKFDEKGNPESLEATGAKSDKAGEESKVKIPDKGKETEIKLGEGDKIRKEPQPLVDEKSGKKTDMYTTDVKPGNTLEKPTQTKKKEEDKDGNDANYRFNANGLVKLSDDMATQLGLPKGTQFKGSLVMDQNGNWYTDKGTTFMDSKGKPIFEIPGLKYDNLNSKTYIFNSKENLNTPEVKDLMKSGISGVVIDSQNKFAESFSTNDKVGVPLRTYEGNPVNNINSLIVPSSHSTVSIDGTKATPEYRIQGEGVAYFGRGYAFTNKGDQLLIGKPENARIDKIFPGSNLDFDVSKNYKATIIPLDSDGSFPGSADRRLIVDSGISDSGSHKYNVVGLDEKGNALDSSSRVFANDVPQGKGSGGLWDSIKAAVGLGEKPGTTTQPKWTESTDTPTTPQPTQPTPPKPTPTPPPEKPKMPEAGQRFLGSLKSSPNPVDQSGRQVPLFGSVGNYERGLVVVASGPNCGHCRTLMNQLPANLPKGIQVVTINGDVNPQFLQQHGISGYPTAIVMDPNTGQAARNQQGQIIGASGDSGIIDMLKRMK